MHSEQIKEEKKRLRRFVQQRLQLLDDEAYCTGSRAMARILTRLDVWKKSEVVATTMARGREVDTRPIIEQAWNEGKTVVIPRVIEETKRLEFRRISSFSQTCPGYYGIQEPDPRQTGRVFVQAIELLIVPGLAFDCYGYRLGYGGGFYDRLLEASYFQTVSLAFDIQLLPRLPVEPFDRPVDLVITETKKIEAKKLREQKGATGRESSE